MNEEELLKDINDGMKTKDIIEKHEITRAKFYRFKNKNKIETIDETEFQGVEQKTLGETKKKSVKKNNMLKNEAENVISTIIKVGYTGLSFGLGEHWNISEDESMQITKPLVSILDRYNMLDKLTQTSDIVMLITALGFVNVPRVMITLNNNKVKKELKKNETENK